MTTANEYRDDVMSVVYRDLVAADLAIGSARAALDTLGWSHAAGELADCLAIVNDLLHDLGAYAGSTGGES